MSTYLLTWNPKKWNWENFESDLKKFNAKGYLDDSWSCGLQGSIRPGDRVFLLKQGLEEPKGVFASGHAKSTSYTEKHWNPKLAVLGKRANYIKVRFDQLLDFNEQIIPRSELNTLRFSDMHWDTQMSGIRIPEKVSSELEKEWGRLLKTGPLPVEFEPNAIEGVVTETLTYTRGRSQSLRMKALNLANGVCDVCDVDFKTVLNGKGLRVLQVHHKKQLSSTDTPRLTKLSDLAVVCANCHMLIHYNPTRSMAVPELRAALRK